MRLLTQGILSLLLLLCYFSAPADAQLVPNMYCGEDSCYSVLGVERDATKMQISKAYRGLARAHHPDYMKSKGATPEEIKAGTEKFIVIATAYETLKDQQARDDYDHYLDNPDQYYYNYYRYYRRQTQVDVKWVVIGVLTTISAFQFVSWQNSYNTAITSLVHNSKYRTAAKEEARARGIWVDKSEQKRQKKYKTREEIKQDEEDLLRKIIEEKMDIRGGYSKPVYTDVLWFQILLLPYFVYKYLHFHARWFYLYNIQKQEFTEQDRIYMICWNLDIKPYLWDMQEEKVQREAIKRELWIKENAKEYKEEKAEEMKIKMASDPKMKRMRRYLNRGGAGRMTFDENEPPEYDY